LISQSTDTDPLWGKLGLIDTMSLSNEKDVEICGPKDLEKNQNPLVEKTTLGEGELHDPMFKHADPNDGDEALKAFAGHDGEVIVMTPEMEKKLLRKIDWNLMPVINLTCWSNWA
jgi:ACS family allantoate permease-like MFS transporter